MPNNAFQKIVNETSSLNEVNASVDTTKHRKGIKRILAYLGPAYLVSVGYMDPGNWATDLQGGAQFGYKLIWVLLMSNLMALLLQSLAARLGIVRRKDLAQVNRELYPPFINFCLYILAEVAIAACDLAEVLGMALGIYLLTGLPLIWGVVFTVLDTFLLLVLQRYGIRKLEAFIISLVAIIGLSFVVQMLLVKPHLPSVAAGFIPSALNKNALFIAIGIIGATVMPHNLYLHSALVQTRKINNTVASIKKAIKFNNIDSVIALNAAFFVNAAILILAATVFYTTGNTQVAKIEEAHQLLKPLVGTTLSPILFAVALIAAGQSSTVTGTLAGQIIMEGYLHLRINPLLRRLLTRLIAIVPAVIVILIYGEEKVDYLLVLSQVILSIQLGFAIIPLIHSVSDKAAMGQFVIKPVTRIAAWVIASILIFLNIKMLVEQSAPVFYAEGYLLSKVLIIIFGLIFVWLFLVTTFLPILRKRLIKFNTHIHSHVKPFENITIAPYKKVAVALDFSKDDEKLIAHALMQGNTNATYLLLHIVESVSATYLGSESDDDETRNDLQRLNFYAQQLQAKGYTVQVAIGFNNRVKEIVRLVHQEKADLLVMGAHQHNGIKDYLFGETINSVRHAVAIPVLVVNLHLTHTTL